MPSMNQLQKQVTDFASGMSAKQRLLLAGAAVVTIAVLGVFVHFLTAPDYKPLMTGMEPEDAQALANKLAAKNISYEISRDGKSVSVPSNQLDASRMEVASDGGMRSGRLGFELFDKMNWGETEFDEKVNYQRAIEGELERSLRTLRDVESARVHLVLPTDSVFLDRERAAKASVVLKLKSGMLSRETQLAIARLVSGAVDNLSPDNVTVIDADTMEPLEGLKRDGFSPSGNLEEALTARLIKTLSPVLGGQHVKASVNVEYDPTTAEETSETYDPKSAVAVTTQRSEEQIGGILTGGIPGTSSNVPGGSGSAKAQVETGDGTQISKTESETYAVNKVARHVMEPAGRIRRITAAVLVDDVIESKQQGGKAVETRRTRTPEELKQIEELAKAAIGADLGRGDSITVQNLSFEAPAIETIPKTTTLERVRVTLNDWSNIVRYVAIFLFFLLAYFLVLRPMKKQFASALRGLPPRAATAQVPEPAPAGLMAAEPRASLPPEQQRLVNIKKQLVEKAKGESLATSQLIQAWIHEGSK
jgi:flagellar M-ring protein FliF